MLTIADLSLTVAAGDMAIGDMWPRVATLWFLIKI